MRSRQESQKAIVYEPDTVWQKEFEEMFPFEETDDQLQAIDATQSGTWKARRSWTV